jgi:hypothetical protein
MTGFSVGIGTFKALKQVLTGEVILRIDTTADNGVTTMSHRPTMSFYNSQTHSKRFSNL